MFVADGIDLIVVEEIIGLFRLPLDEFFKRHDRFRQAAIRHEHRAICYDLGIRRMRITVVLYHKRMHAVIVEIEINSIGREQPQWIDAGFEQRVAVLIAGKRKEKR
jgi:hypothetical protein